MSTTPTSAVLVLDVDQVAQLLRCSAKTVRAKAQTLGGLKLGTDWIFPAGALARRLDALADLAHNPAAPAAAAVSVPPAARGRRAPPLLPWRDFSR